MAFRRTYRDRALVSRDNLVHDVQAKTEMSPIARGAAPLHRAKNAPDTVGGNRRPKVGDGHHYAFCLIPARCDRDGRMPRPVL